MSPHCWCSLCGARFAKGIEGVLLLWKCTQGEANGCSWECLRLLQILLARVGRARFAAGISSGSRSLPRKSAASSRDSRSVSLRGESFVHRETSSGCVLIPHPFSCTFVESFLVDKSKCTFSKLA